VTLHGGLGLDHSYLRPWLDPLAEQMQVVYYDQRANGRSTGSAGAITMQRLADDVDAVRRRLGHERISLLGHSYGGFVALQYALTYPERLAAMVLCDTDARGPEGASIQRELRRLGAAPEAIEALGTTVTSDDLTGWWSKVSSLYLPHSEPSTAHRVVERLVYSETARAAGNRALAAWDVSGRLGEIRAATLVIGGRDDFLFAPDRAELLAAGIPGAELRIYDASGHMPFVEEQERFLGDVGSFVVA